MSVALAGNSARRSRNKAAQKRNLVKQPIPNVSDTFGVRGVFNMDALEYLKDVPDKYFDATITDFPYGVNLDYGDAYEDSVENLKKLIRFLVPELRRVSERVVIFTGVENCFLYPKPTWTLAWVYEGGYGGGCRWGFPSWQPILIYGADPYMKRRLGRRPDIIRGGGSSGDSIHPCPKPLKAMKKVVERVSLPGEHIFDPLMGRGTTGMACLATGRSFSGTEIGKAFFEEAKRNLENGQAQMLNTKLFTADPGYTQQLTFHLVKEEK